MRYSIMIFAAAVMAMPLTAASATGAQAQQYCGFLPHLGAVVQCGYSNRESCENAIGKGAMCFINPYVARNEKRPGPMMRESAGANG